jgi:hypothetical protein
VPYEWIEPDIALQARGATIYWCYKDNDRMSFWFTTDASTADNEMDESWFDVRTLHAWESTKGTRPAENQDDHIIRALFEAVMRGEIGVRP